MIGYVRAVLRFLNGGGWHWSLVVAIAGMMALAPAASANPGEPYDDPAFALGVQAATLSPWGPGPEVAAAYDLTPRPGDCARAGRPILVVRTCMPKQDPVTRCNYGAHEGLHVLYNLNHLPHIDGFEHVETEWWQSNPFCVAFRDVALARRADRLETRNWYLQDQRDWARLRLRKAQRRIAALRARLKELRG